MEGSEGIRLSLLTVDSEPARRTLSPLHAPSLSATATSASGSASAVVDAAVDAVATPPAPPALRPLDAWRYARLYSFLTSTPSTSVASAGGRQASVRSSGGVRAYRRYSQVHIVTPDVVAIATELFAAWDVDGVGEVTAVDLPLRLALPPAFCAALGRVLANDDAGVIYLENVVETLGTLMYGDVDARARLLLRFVDVSAANGAALAELTKQLRDSDALLSAKAAVDEAAAAADAMRYEDLLLLFVTAPRGDEALQLFCDHLLRVLRLSRPTPSTTVSTTTSSAPPPAVCATPASITREQGFIALLAAFQVAMFASTYDFYARVKGAKIELCFAKAFGANARFLSLFIYIFCLRSTLGWLATLPGLRQLVPLDAAVALHSHLGVCLFAHGFGHSVAYFVYYYAYNDGTSMLVPEHLLTRGGYFDSGGGDSITGLWLLGFSILITVTALTRSLSSDAYALFARSHFLVYALWLPLLYVHTPNYWPYYLSALLLLGVDRGYDLLRKTRVCRLTSKSRVVTKDMTFVCLPAAPRGSDAERRPGCYYRLRVPALSAWEWHPFSLASSVTADDLVFLIAASGDWTRRLHALVDAGGDGVDVWVQGPFATPTQRVALDADAADQRLLLVATGVGITPFLSAIATATATPTTASVAALTVLWIIRDPLELRFYVAYVHRLLRDASTATQTTRLELYLTGLGTARDATALLAQCLFLLSLAKSANAAVAVHFGRPDLDAVFRQVRATRVFFCGAPTVQREVATRCRAAQVELVAEDFDAGANAVKRLQRWWRGGLR